MTICFLTSCDAQNIGQIIIGQWTVDSALNYYEGNETMLKINSDYNMYLGTISDPKQFKFTKYKELFAGQKEDNIFTSYTIKDSSIYCKNGVKYKIKSVSKNNLIMEYEVDVIWFDKPVEHPRQILTFYLSKVKP